MRQRQNTEDFNEPAPASRDRAPRHGADAVPNESGLEMLVRRFARLNMQAAALAVRLPVKSKG